MRSNFTTAPSSSLSRIENGRMLGLQCFLTSTQQKKLAYSGSIPASPGNIARNSTEIHHMQKRNFLELLWSLSFSPRLMHVGRFTKKPRPKQRKFLFIQASSFVVLVMLRFVLKHFNKKLPRCAR